MSTQTSSHSGFTGSCFCTRINYTSTTLPTMVTNCHCLTCRRLSGGPFLPFAMVPIANFTFHITNDATESENSKSPNDRVAIDLPTAPGIYKNSLHVFALSSVALRASCVHCHSHIAMWYPSGKLPEIVSVTVGTIDERSFSGGIQEAEKVLRAVEKDIFWGEKASWWGKGGVDCAREGEPGRFEKFDKGPII